MHCTADILRAARHHLHELSGHCFDLISISKPISPDAAANLAKVTSKLSPILGNLIEFHVVEFLNDQEDYKKWGTWKRQDPGFPDAVFEGKINPRAGFEIKAWFPLATEITARFKDSQNHFIERQTDMCMLAWLPDKLIFGQPRVIDLCTIPGHSIAEARDNHYHNPPDYLVLEPGDTTARTANLQQTNTNGYKWQSTSTADLTEARALVDSWGGAGRAYSPTPEYQALLRELLSRYSYRLDTNFAKLDRIAHPEIEAFKARVLGMKHSGLTIREWKQLLSRGGGDQVRSTLSQRLDIREADAESILR